jgi:hypothetical protein
VISQMMTGLSMGGAAGGRGGAAVHGVNASVLGKNMHAGGWGDLLFSTMLFCCVCVSPRLCMMTGLSMGGGAGGRGGAEVIFFTGCALMYAVYGGAWLHIHACIGSSDIYIDNVC